MAGMDNERRGGRENRRELARDRTDWALHRTQLAVERTFSAWLRTGLAALGRAPWSRVYVLLAVHLGQVGTAGRRGGVLPG